MKYALIIYLVTFLALICQQLSASPPYDLTDFQALDKKMQAKKPRTVDLNDITFVDDHSEFKDNLSPTVPRTKFPVDGRSLPNRKGRPLYKFKRNEPLTVLKDSKDGFWVAVESTGFKKQKAWLPKSAIIIPEKINTSDDSEDTDLTEDPISSTEETNPKLEPASTSEDSSSFESAEDEAAEE